MLQIYFPSCTLTKGYSLELQKCYFLYVHKYICSKVQILLYFAGYALGIWICGCSLFYKRELWASKSAGSHSSKSLKISGCKRWCPKDLRVRAPAAPVLTHSLLCRTKASLWYLTVTSVIFSMRKSTLTFILLEFRLFCVEAELGTNILGCEISELNVAISICLQTRRFSSGKWQTGKVKMTK